VPGKVSGHSRPDDVGKDYSGGMPVGALVGKRKILERTSPEKKRNKWEKILIGGGYLFCPSFDSRCRIGHAQLFKNHRKEVYRLLEIKREGSTEGDSGIPGSRRIKCPGHGNRLTLSNPFPFSKKGNAKLPHSIHRFTD